VATGGRCQTGDVATYVVFLRAINLGKHRRVPMAELVDCLGEAGCTDLATHLATGNVRLAAAARSWAAVERTVEQACRERFGFEVPAIAYTTTEVAALVDEAEGLGVTEVHRYVTLLKEPVPADAAVELDAWSAPGEGARVGTRAVHWWSEHGTQGSRMGNELLARRLGPATTRTLRVVSTVSQKWCR
jgi:uncharacterized protein (DUF1697 family)